MWLPLTFVLAAAPVTFQAGVQTPPLIGDPAGAALRFAASRRAELGLDSRSELKVVGRYSTTLGGSGHRAQTVDGREGVGARVVVTFDEQQRVIRVSSSLKRFSTVNSHPTLTARQALARATQEVDGAWLQTNGEPYGGVTARAFWVEGQIHAGYWCFVPTLKASENWHVAIDGTDGAVLRVENRAKSSNDANVYPSSPGGLNGGVGITPTSAVTLPNLPDAGSLRGTELRALNCCPTAGCDPDAGPARAQGQQQTFNGVVDFDVAICDQRPRASNDPLVHASGDFVYAPVDPPGTQVPSIRTPADFDEFAEVHAYFHVSKAYSAVRELSRGPLTGDAGFPVFSMRNTGPGGDLPAVWVNVSDPDLSNAQPNAQGVYVSDTLARTDNALFLARENMEFLLLPPQVLQSDALVIYQGSAADFAYDGPVLWHEFGHGAIHSTADWSTVVSFDNFSANNESSALDEGMADLIAAMTGSDPVVGAYVGPRIDPTTSAIRRLDNTEQCPDVLWGESHQDSLHFTGAVWDARQLFLVNDNGRTFDGAIYAAMVSFPPDVNFEKAAEIIALAVGQAFPSDGMAADKVRARFDARGATHCSKTLDVTDRLGTPRPYFGMVGTVFGEVADNSQVPGPYQFKIRAPRGARAVTVRAQGFGGGGGGMSRLEVLAAVGRPVGFAKNGSVLANNATHRAPLTSSMGNITGTLAIDVPCGGEVYLALTNSSRRDRQLFDVEFGFDAATSCPEMPDAGMPPMPDAGMEPPKPQDITLAPVTDLLGSQAQGCGCTSVDPLAFAAGACWLLLRRIRNSRDRRKV